MQILMNASLKMIRYNKILNNSKLGKTLKNLRVIKQNWILKQIKENLTQLT